MILRGIKEFRLAIMALIGKAYDRDEADIGLQKPTGITKVCEIIYGTVA